MDISTAINNLCELLCVNIVTLPFKQIAILVRKRHLTWHPDKCQHLDNPNIFKDKWMLLKESWDFYKNWESSQPGPSQENLFCDEELFSDEDADYNGTPYSDEFFNPSPTKDFCIPDTHQIYFRSKSNRRAGKTFAIYFLRSDDDKLAAFYSLYNLDCEYFGAFHIRTNKDISLLLLTTKNDYKLMDVKKKLKKIKILNYEIFYAVKFKAFISFCVEKYQEPFYEPNNCGRGPQKKTISEPFNNYILVNFALRNEIADVLTLMYEYSHLATPCDRQNPSNEHLDDHTDHQTNAISFNHLGDRRRAATNAINCVVAKLFSELKNEKPADFISRKCKELGDKIFEIEDPQIFGESWYYCTMIFKKFKILSHIILNNFLEGKPRNRWVVLTGEYKSGKTTYAAAFTKFFEGVSINLNCDRSRLSFFLGNAIGKRFVLFDDVKGTPPKKSGLPYGHGFKNLDDLRDHLDGHIEVQLEKKNHQPISQVFPPGIITCNRYNIEQSLIERVKGPFLIKPSPLFMDHDVPVTLETIFIGLVWFNLVPAEGYVLRHITKKIQMWKDRHSVHCDCLTVSVVYYYFNYGCRRRCFVCGGNVSNC